MKAALLTLIGITGLLAPLQAQEAPKVEVRKLNVIEETLIIEALVPQAEVEYWSKQKGTVMITPYGPRQIFQIDLLETKNGQKRLRLHLQWPKPEKPKPPVS